MGPSGDFYTLRHISKNLTLISLICMFGGELSPPQLDKTMLVTILLSTLVRSSESVIYSHCVYMYTRMWWWHLGMLQEVPSMWFTGILVSDWLLEFICHKDNVRFSNLNQWMSVQCLQGFHTWSSCYMWSWTASTQHLYTAAPHTADDE